MVLRNLEKNVLTLSRLSSNLFLHQFEVPCNCNCNSSRLLQSVTVARDFKLMQKSLKCLCLLMPFGAILCSLHQTEIAPGWHVLNTIFFEGAQVWRLFIIFPELHSIKLVGCSATALRLVLIHVIRTGVDLGVMPQRWDS